MRSIDVWLKSFKASWERKNVPGVLELFDKDVVYYETPFYQLSNFHDLESEWKMVHQQENISLQFSVFLREGNKSAVIWSLEYTDTEFERQHFKGVYLIELNKANKCIYFHQTCESQE